MSAHNGTGKRLNLIIPFSWGLRTFVGDNCSVEMVVQLETALVIGDHPKWGAVADGVVDPIIVSAMVGGVQG